MNFTLLKMIFDHYDKYNDKVKQKQGNVEINVYTVMEVIGAGATGEGNYCQ